MRTFLRITFLTVIGGGLLVYGTNCSFPVLEQQDSGSFDAASYGDPSKNKVSLMNFDQTFQSMLNVTDQANKATDAQRNAYAALAGTLNESSDIDTVNSSALVATTSLCG